MRITKKLQKEIDKWIINNGGCKIDIKEENIDLFNGGLFQDMDEDKANLWIGDLDDTLRYLNRLRNFLRKKGFNTRRSMNDFIMDKNKKGRLT